MNVQFMECTLIELMLKTLALKESQTNLLLVIIYVFVVQWNKNGIGNWIVLILSFSYNSIRGLRM